jgi:demethylmenaquinone methyltransferase/2-methoxy-6-polyprenyl-1,4-benzoquinol methylase
VASVERHYKYESKIYKMDEGLVKYYNERANEYDKVYSIPEEQDDLAKSIKIFQDLFASKIVLEVACGTGYWTNHISQTASSIFATDINESVVNIAKERCSNSTTKFEVVDMFSIESSEKFDAFFGGFIWSHILIQDIDDFLFKTSKLLNPKSIIAFIDSKPVANSSHDKKKISKIDEFGNTFQTRQLNNGSTHLVLKNFPSKEFLFEKLTSIAEEFQFIDLDNYWIIISKLK